MSDYYRDDDSAQYYYSDYDGGYDRDRKKRGGCRRGLIAVLLILLFIVVMVLVLFAVFNLKIQNSFTTSSFSEEQNVEDKMDRIKGLVDKYYLEEANDEALAEGVYAGLVEGLEDPYSEYYTQEEFQDLMETASGVYAGIGALMSQDMTTGIITITRPFDDSPAQKAGLIAGDILTKVNGEEIGDQELSVIVSQIKGEPGTDVVLTISRDGKEMDFTVTRDYVEVTTVQSQMLDENTGYIYILEFDEVTTEQFKKALSSLQAEGMEDLIVDLRDNPGGNLAVVVEILDEILPEGMIVYTEDKYGNREEYKSDGKTVLDIPMAVLINGNSASASEIFAGAIKDYGWGTLVGTTTFGKGIVQRIFDLGDGTAIKLTISKYYTPNGNNIHDIGIAPDVEIELPDEAYEDGYLSMEEDVQLNKALEILNGEEQEGRE